MPNCQCENKTSLKSKNPFTKESKMTTIFEEIRYIYLIHLEFLVQKIVLVNLFTLNVGKDIIIAIIIHNTKKLKTV